MNAAQSRKIVYVLLIVVMFTALVGVSRVLDVAGDNYKLSQKSLGQVDPVSGTAQLVLLGFRGVATTFLWQEVIDLKKKERWFEIRPLLESITLLQPNFVTPWEHQAWNMAYNIAAEWESVPDKYYWIRQGIDYMKRACVVNAKKPDLEWYVGWLYYNKFGMSDEHEYLREMLRKETDIEYSTSEEGIKDNFLKAYDHFTKANVTLEQSNRKPKKMGIHPFRSYPASARTQYADFQGQEGIFGEATRNAWRRSYDEWVRFGSYGGSDRNKDIFFRLEYTKDEWDKLNDEAKYWADRYRKVVRYGYWKTRTKTEGTNEMQVAREALYKASAARKSGDYASAISEYERAFPIWRKILETVQDLREDTEFTEDAQKYEYSYMAILNHVNKPAPEKRPFEGLLQPLVPTARPVPQQRDLYRPNVDVAPAAKSGSGK